MSSLGRPRRQRARASVQEVNQKTASTWLDGGSGVVVICSPPVSSRCVTNSLPCHHDTANRCQCPNPEEFVATRSCHRLRHMAAADALVASATLVLGSRSDKTAKLPQVIEALYKEFGKDECKAVMQGGAKQWFEQHPLDFRVDAHDAGGHPPWHSVTLIGGEWQTVAATSTAVTTAAPGLLCFVYGLHLLFRNSKGGWPSTKEELRVGAAPLCSGMGAKLYHLSMLGGVKVLHGEALVWNTEKMRLLVLSTPTAIRQNAEILVHNSATADDYPSDEAIEHGFVETNNGPLRGAALAVDCGPLHVLVEAMPTALPEPDAEPPSQQSTDPTTRLLEAMLSNVDAEQPDREADVVTRGIALGMLRARTGMIRLETRAEAAEARVTTLEAELRQASQMLSNALETQVLLEGRLLQQALQTASSSAVVQGEPMPPVEAHVVELEGLQ